MVLSPSCCCCCRFCLPLFSSNVKFNISPELLISGQGGSWVWSRSQLEPGNSQCWVDWTWPRNVISVICYHCPTVYHCLPAASPDDSSSCLHWQTFGRGQFSWEARNENWAGREMWRRWRPGQGLPVVDDGDHGPGGSLHLPPRPLHLSLSAK